MRGIAGDAVLIAVAIIVLALVFYRLWYPPLKRAIQDWHREFDKSNR